VATTAHNASRIASRWWARLLFLPRQEDGREKRHYKIDKYSVQLEKPYWPDYKVGLPLPDASFLSRFCSRDIFSFAQANHRLRNLSSQGNSSARIMSPGTRKTQPGMMGRIKPIIPMRTRPAPMTFLRNFFTSYIVDVRQGEVEAGFCVKHFGFWNDLIVLHVSTSPFCLCQMGIFLDPTKKA